MFWKRIKPPAWSRTTDLENAVPVDHDGIPAGLPLAGSLGSSLLTVRVTGDKKDSRKAYHEFDGWSLITLSGPGSLISIS